MADIQFQLKTAPPRPGRAAPVRKRLEHRWAEINDRTAIIVTAPQGFGKTTLLGQWRRNWLARGACVAWATLDAQDDGARFVDLLLFALRAATGRESFAIAAAQNLLQANRELDALTALLAAVAQLASPTVVILDDVHRMPQATMQELLAYLLNNAPPNLHFLVGSRRPLEVPLTDLMAAGRVASFDARDLRLTLDESVEILRSRFGSRIGLDDAVRLHELTEGWPLGLQLAASTIERADDLHEVIGQLSARRGDIQRFFFESLTSRLPRAEAGFLVRIAILEVVNTEVAEAVTGCREAAAYLESLANETPIATEGEARDWLRLHSMARDFLLGQFDKLPVDERRACYERAAAWYADRGLLREAARHALAAGNDELAVAHVSQCLLDIAREGRLAEARDWLKRLPSSLMARDVRLQLTAAWIMALGSDAATVPGLLAQAARHPDFDEDCRFLTALVASAAAIFRDTPGLVADALQSLESTPASATALEVCALANSQAVLALYRGDADEVRRRLAHALAGGHREAGMRLVLGYSDLILGLSYLLDGNATRAVALLQPRLEAAERDMGRRSTIAAMLAGVLAAAQLVCDESDQVLATLADRLDVIERLGMPDSVMLAYRSLAAIALRTGNEARAVEILEGLRELGVARDQPRVVLTSLFEQVRVHALRGRVETASELLSQLEALEPVFRQPTYQPFLWLFRLQRGLAAGYTAIAKSGFEAAEQALRVVLDLPVHLRRHPLVLVARALAALVARERGQTEARQMLEEVLGLANLSGMRSYVAAAHPMLAGMLEAADDTARPAEPARTSAAAAARVMPTPVAVQAQSGLLTPKEARILALLASGRANKEIARAMDIGEQTVKWHLKNVFFKLNAASRKHAVDRARLLGLLEA